MNPKYFLVRGGAVRAAVYRWMAKYRQQKSDRQAVMNEFGAEGTYGNERRLEGLVFKEGVVPAPTLWRVKSAFSNIYVPNGTKAEAKALRTRLRNLPLVGARDFQTEVLGESDPFRFMDELKVHWMTFEWVGTSLILKVPDVKPGADGAERWSPPDDLTVPLKNSEYWALKESLVPEAASSTDPSSLATSH